MESAVTIPVEMLLAPVSPEMPQGLDLRDLAKNPAGRAVYDAIRGARTLARKKEMLQLQGDKTIPAGPPDEWRAVLSNSGEAIASRSKDLEIATYLIEAAVRLHGFSGLRDGFRVYRELVSQYWASIYPAAEDGPAKRVAGLGSLNGDMNRDGALILPISQVAMVTGNGLRLGLFDYQIAEELEKLSSAALAERVKDGQVTFKLFEEAARKTPESFRQRTIEELTQCIDEFDKLNVVLAQVCGPDAPPSSRITDALQKCLHVVQKVGVTPTKATIAISNTSGNPVGGGQAGVAGMMPIPGPFQTRDQAFAGVRQVVEYFRMTEPQSLVIPALEQALRWGNLSHYELYKELIASDDARNSLYKLVGIRPTEPKAQE